MLRTIESQICEHVKSIARLKHSWLVIYDNGEAQTPNIVLGGCVCRQCKSPTLPSYDKLRTLELIPAGRQD